MLWESLLTNNYDCDNSSFLVADVASRLGMPTWFLIFPNHLAIRTEDFFFETTCGRYFSLPSAAGSLPLSCKEISASDTSIAAFISYSNRGVAKFSLGDYIGAIEDFTKAIELNPNYAEAYYNRGLAKVKLKDYDSAFIDILKAKRLI
ncbi:MAG: tetratricopeptide repeat protein [Candidatus Micrarchaeota archaeon]|nr:tetratricopeptide repeat protein [Candidatus Micrarchaeota archaeon]